MSDELIIEKLNNMKEYLKENVLDHINLKIDETLLKENLKKRGLENRVSQDQINRFNDMSSNMIKNLLEVDIKSFYKRDLFEYIVLSEINTQVENETLEEYIKEKFNEIDKEYKVPDDVLKRIKKFIMFSYEVINNS